MSDWLFGWDLDWRPMLGFIVVVLVASWLLKAVDRGSEGMRTWRNLRHRWRRQRKGVQMDDWQRRTGRHDGWS